MTDCKRHRAWPVLLGMLCCVCAAHAQLSGYESVSYGYSSNPLCNYEVLPDRLVQNYLELSFTHEFSSSDLALQYTGGLMAFRDLSVRTYYEHTLAGTYAIRFEKEEEGDDSAETAPEDSSASYLLLGLIGSARHDRADFAEYDNSSFGASCGYRAPLGAASFIRLLASSEYRAYSSLAELSNVTTAARASVGFQLDKHLTLEWSLGAGLKHYTSAMFDTVLFETKRSYVQSNGNGNGKGKGGANILVPSKKQLFVNPTSNGTSQYSAGVSLTGHWDQTSCSFQASYRLIPAGASPRYLAQVAGSSTLREDIYNDSFSSSGPAASLSVTQQLPAKFRVMFNAAAGTSRFNVPALNLAGEQIAAERSDRRGSAELAVMRSFELGSGFILEAGVNAHAERNQSNDDYNDYSLRSIAVSLAVGF